MKYSKKGNDMHPVSTGPCARKMHEWEYQSCVKRTTLKKADRRFGPQGQPFEEIALK
jgi:hypothetical protein